MARTEAGSRLTELHRLAQVQISAQTVAQLLQVWPLLDLEDLDATTRRWLTAAIPIVRAARGRSARLASEYLRRFIAAESGLALAAPLATVVPDLPLARIATSLITTGPVSIKSAVAVGRDLASAAEIASASSAAAGTRHALDGGREVILTASDAHPDITGVKRIVSSNACSYCRGKAADRGGVLDFKAHDNCHCQPEPVVAG